MPYVTFAEELPLRTIARFAGTEAINPESWLVQDPKGALYGTSPLGGANHYGAVFELPPAGGGARRRVQIVWSSQGFADGYSVAGPLTLYDGSLYGTTFEGGANGIGTVYRLDPPASHGTVWSHTILHSFGAPVVNDGFSPGGLEGGFNGGLYIDSKGNAYGTTASGGDCTYQYVETSACGVIFAVSASGHYAILHNFQGPPDGATAGYGLSPAPDGMLYGVTAFGGDATDSSCPLNNNGPFGCGTVFKVDPQSGTETVIYRFTGGKDGFGPTAPVVVDDKGDVFGTTNNLGGGGSGGGVVFEITNAGVFRVIHTFKGPDGYEPNAPLSLAGDVLYGTTDAGGGKGKGCITRWPGIEGCGVVFSLTPPDLDNKTWTYTVVHRFTGKADGSGCGNYPENCGGSGLFVGDDGLYGTTEHGGLATDSNYSGDGTAYMLFDAPVRK